MSQKSVILLLDCKPSKQGLYGSCTLCVLMPRYAVLVFVDLWLNQLLRHARYRNCSSDGGHIGGQADAASAPMQVLVDQLVCGCV